MARGQYILDEHGNPKREPNLFKWAMWLEHSHDSKGKDNRIIARDHIGEIFISTVFLGLDHNPDNLRRTGKRGKPVLWETMIFGGQHDQYMRRYASRDDAVVGHSEALEMVKDCDRDFKELERMFALSGDWGKKR